MRAGIKTGSQGIALLCSYPGYVAGSAGPFHGPFHGRGNLVQGEQNIVYDLNQEVKWWAL
jgi:hypothetical protein